MNQVPLREFQLHPKKYLKDFPFELTARGGVIAVVSAPNTVVNKLKEKNVNNRVATSEETAEEHVVTARVILPEGDRVAPDAVIKLTGRCQPQHATCRAFGVLYRVSYSNDEGEITEDRFLCEYHEKAARNSGVDVEDI